MCRQSLKTSREPLRPRNNMDNNQTATPTMAHNTGNSLRSSPENHRRHHNKSSKAKAGKGKSQGSDVTIICKNGSRGSESPNTIVETQVFRGRGHVDTQSSENRHLKRHSNMQRSSPSKHLHMINQQAEVSRTSPVPSNLRQSPPTTPGKLPAYAGAKFSDPPSPKVLPKPPVHWVSGEGAVSNNSCAEMTSILKVMLKVQA